MGPRATVVIPTRDNGPSIARSIDSVLAQTMDDFELLIVGDGAVDVTRRLVTARAQQDPRIRFYDNPKGPRHGEIHRHAALREARGAMVAYLSDDDLWLPNHLEEMAALLSGADFANTSALWVAPDGSVGVQVMDFADPAVLRVTLEARGRIPLSTAAHTMDAYRRLPHGWRTTPSGTPTDWWMWRQFLAQPGIRLASSTAVTALRFPNLRWRDSPEAKLESIERWWGLVSDDAWRRDRLPDLQLRATTDSLRRAERSLISIRRARWYRALRSLAWPFRSIRALRVERARSRTTGPRRPEGTAGLP